MSKITFRADEDLVRRLEAFDASKSEVMREALRSYLDDAERERREVVETALAERVDELVAERIEAYLGARSNTVGTEERTPEPRDLNVNITLDGVAADADVNEERRPDRRGEDERKTRRDRRDDERANRACGQCGESISSNHVYCPNCGEKAAHRVFCECGDELRTDWAFCPGCGRRTPAANVLDRT